MIKIISGKKWEEMEQKLVDLQLDLNKALDDEQTYLKQVEYLQKEIENKKNELEKERNDNIQILNIYEIETIKYKDTIKKLKTLLTKNKIDYSKLVKKAK